MVVGTHGVDLVAMALAPAVIHPMQHFGPVLTYRAAGTGMHFQIGVVGVRLAG